jgi:hypothetical protein
VADIDKAVTKAGDAVLLLLGFSAGVMATVAALGLGWFK